MSVRYYLSPIVGDGTSESPYRPKVADYPVSWAGGFQCAADGTPACTDCVSLVEAEDHSALLEDPDLFAFPLTGPVPPEVCGHDLTGAGTWFEALRRVGAECNPAFDLSVIAVESAV